MHYTVEQIEEKARQVSMKAGVYGIFPVDVEKIALTLGYKCVYFLPKNNEQEDIAGAVDHAEKKIYINKEDNFRRQFFTMAHEIGHIVLHGDNEAFVDYRFSHSDFFDRKEMEANQFAAELVMPKEIFTYKWKELNKNLYKLSDFFGSSSTAIAVRVEALRLE